MENKLEILTTIKKVQPNEALYNRIVAKIEKPVQYLVTPAWLRVAAAIILVLIGIEGYILTQPTDNSATSDTLITLQSNDLYNE